MDQRHIESLLQPDAYPDPTDVVTLVQTHISWIFLAGEFVYKIKKPVDFGFLNFSTLDRRRFYCHEEIRLNRRLCPDVYLRVMPLRESAAGAAFHGDGAVIDYAVKMVRLPAERMADRLVSKGELTSADVTRIATTVAEFHDQAERSKEIAEYGKLDSIEGNWEENFRQVEEFAEDTIASRDLQLIRRWVEAFMAENAALFSARATGGFIRECDGDLHLENICLTDRVSVFDCIEFNNRFRYIDTVADISFLLMDLEFHGRRDLSRKFLEEYCAVSGDSGALSLVGFYSVYRAFVRGKVESFKLKDHDISAEEKRVARAKANRYFRLARGYILREKLLPSLIIVSGLTGSGKSTIAEALSIELGLNVLSSDRLRKELAGVPLQQHDLDDYGKGIYSKSSTETTYREMITRADACLASGEGVIVDATCRRRMDRENLRRVAERYSAQFFIIELESHEEVIRQRLAERLHQGSSISDGRWEVYLRQREEFEPVLENEKELFVVDGSAPLYEILDTILAHIGLLH